MTKTPLLDVVDLTKIFPTGGIFRRKYVHAVEDVTFSLPSEEPLIVTLAGESGSGKTTIANMLLGLMRPTIGTIKYKGTDTSKMSKNEWRIYRKEVQAVFQDPYSVYNPVYRIDRALYIPLKKFGIVTSRAEAEGLIAESFEAVGLRPKDLLGRYPHQLSGGERQRIMLARLLCLKPKIIIADEPISMIDVSLRAMFLNALTEFRDKYNISSIFITHNLTNAYYLGGDLMILCRGNVVEKGRTKEVLKNPIHPYTKILVSSIPHSKPEERWKGELKMKIADIAETIENTAGCIFCDRCPSSTPECRNTRTKLGDVNQNHQVACLCVDN